MERIKEIRHILESVQNGEMTVGEAEKYLRRQPFEEMGFAKLDMHRELRSGFPEVIYCAGKPDEYLVSIFRKMYEKNGEVFGTRATKAQYELMRKELPQVQYDSVSRILKIDE
ncbi:MAG: 1-(5-phosphoribosyl)-5-amino-4-imidazole-carboxylate carboxylase, partial [Lachnospiraceae bacterium]|nr:1-(5-phosphoribosyl)-5-amino-4-imidazole-carboxylate carboxylase [Lachnospiraceae bacterium]